MIFLLIVDEGPAKCCFVLFVVPAVMGNDHSLLY